MGRAVVVLLVKEGADIAVVYRNEHRDGRETERLVLKEGRRCLLIAVDIGDEKFCKSAVRQTVKELGAPHILVNDAAEQHPQETIGKITEKQFVRTFRTNIFSMFFLTKAGIST